MPLTRTAKAAATWATALCSVVLVGLVLHKMSPRTEPWTFAVTVPEVPQRGPVELQAEIVTAKDNSKFVHAPSSVVMRDGGLTSFWYRATTEGASDAELVSARYDGTRWGPESVVTNSATVSHDFGITIKSLANPVPLRRSENEVWLFFAASRLSGWATCEIGLLRSLDNGATWGRAERIYASPFINISHLTKSTPFLFSDGRIGLPVYQEMTKKFPVLLVLDDDGHVIDKRRMGGGGKVGFQPMVVPTGPSTAIAFVRRLKGRSVAKILITRTEDGGKTWTRPVPTELPNPGGPISALRYDASHVLLAFNDDPAIESNITLALTDLSGTTYKRVGVVARMDQKDLKHTVAYPFLVESAPGQFDVVYSRPLKTINHVRISSAWIEAQAQQQTAQRQ